MKAGSESVVEFSFRNNTNADVKGTDYDIVLYKNDKEVNRIDGVDIPCDMVKTVIMKDVTSVLDPEESTYHATVNYAKDELPENNASAKNEVKILLPDYPVPTALKATAAGNYVNLAWIAPDLLNRKPKVTEESFEDYKTFSIDGVGGWTMYDGDKQKTIQITLNTTGQLGKRHAQYLVVVLHFLLSLFSFLRFSPYIVAQHMASTFSCTVLMSVSRACSMRSTTSPFSSFNSSTPVFLSPSHIQPFSKCWRIMLSASCTTSLAGAVTNSKPPR